MGFQYSVPSIVSVSGGVTLDPFIAKPDASQVLKHASHEMVNGNNVEDAYTVTAGKTFYLMGVWFQGVDAVAITNYIFENDGTTIVLRMTNLTNQGVGITAGGCPFHAYTAGQIVKVRGPTGKNVNIWGYEE